MRANKQRDHFLGNADIDNQSLHFSVQKMSDKTIAEWIHFDKSNGKNIPFLEDAQYATDSLSAPDSFQKEKNEIWIATLSLKNPTEDSWQSSILYYVAVVTSPHALFTSQTQGYKSSKIPSNLIAYTAQLEIALHSFSARIMLYKNPQRIYMVQVALIDDIQTFLNKLPQNSIHLGDKKSFEYLVKVQKDPLLILPFRDIEKEDNESEEEYKTRMREDQQEAEEKVKKYKIDHIIELMKNHPYKVISKCQRPPSGIRVCPGWQESIAFESPDKTTGFFTKASKTSHEYQWLFSKYFKPTMHRIYAAINLKVLAGITEEKSTQPTEKKIAKQETKEPSFSSILSSVCAKEVLLEVPLKYREDDSNPRKISGTKTKDF